MAGRVIYTVKEFDLLIPQSGMRFLSSPNRAVPLSDADFDELVDYLLTSVKEEGKQLFHVMKLSSHSHFGKAIQLKNYVGMIELPRSKNRIEILPKVYSGSGEVSDVNQIKCILLSMLSSLKDFPILDLGGAGLDLKRLNLYEVFIRIFLSRVLELSKRGLRSDYFETEENSSSFKGRLIVSGQVKYNMAHNERFYVRHDEYSLSRPENRILKTAVKKLFCMTEDPENAYLARRVLVYFDEVDDSFDYESDYRRISFDSSNQGYLGVIQWAMVFLRDKSFSIFGGNTQGQSLLFPMDRIFEQYIASQINRLIKLHNQRYHTHYRFVSQESSHYLFDVPKSFKIRPDIKISDGETILLDTKWKILSDKKARNNISQADMYQMYAYSKRYQAPQVFLLYPYSPYCADITDTEYEATQDMLKTHVSIQFLDLNNIVNNSKKNILSPEMSLYGFLLHILKTEAGSSQIITTM